MRARTATILLAAVIALAGCASTGSTGATEAHSEEGEQQTEGFDVATIEPRSDVHAMVPTEVAERGKLVAGIALDYPPAEFVVEGKPAGYNVEFARALARVMDLEAVIVPVPFAEILPMLGDPLDVGISSITITPNRLSGANMISYLQVGSAFGVKRGNPAQFDPSWPCGSTVGVQAGTLQEQTLRQMAAECATSSAAPLKVVLLQEQTEVTPNIVSGKWDAALADWTVMNHLVDESGGRLQVVGEPFDTLLQGATVAKDDAQMTVVVQAATQHLMDEGYLDAILETYGLSEIGLTQAQINPIN